MVKSLILFLNCFIIVLHGYTQPVETKRTTNCDSKRFQDSLISRYIDNGAEKLPGLYNNPDWQLFCDSIIAVCPNIAGTYQLKAVPYIKNGEYEKAFALNDKAVELEPQRYTGYRGFLKCIFTKDYEGAIIDFRKAQQLMPNGGEMDHNYKFYEGLCNLELRNYSKSEENFKQDIFIQTGGDTSKTLHFNTLLYIGILYYEMHRNAMAKEYLYKCLKIYEKLPEANYYLAMVYKNERDPLLKTKYLQIAREAIAKGYTMNEDNIYYANYPHQITMYEINKELE